MAMLIANEGFTVATAGSLRDARRQMALQEPDIVLLDLHAARRQRHGAVRRRQAPAERRGRADHRPRQPRDVDPGACASAPPTTSSSRSSLKQLQGVLSRVDQAGGAEGGGRRPARRRSSQRATSATLWGRSAPMRRVYEQIVRVARTAVTVFITGESGTGKEVVAQHRARPQPAPQPPVPRGQLRRDLAAPDRERDLRPREGQLHRRRPPAPRLLRARQRRHAVPRRDHRDAARPAGQAAARARDRHLHAGRLDAGAGDRRAHHRRDQPRPGRRGRATASCARTCSTGSTCSRSTCRRCASAVEDVPLLAEHFLAQIGAARGRRSKRFGADGPRRASPRYRWPGNVRELRNVVYRAYVMAPGATIVRRCLPTTRRRRRRRRPRRRPALTVRGRHDARRGRAAADARHPRAPRPATRKRPRPRSASA